MRITAKAILITVFLLLLAPLWFMATGSVQDIHGVMQMPPRLLPLHATFANYRAMLTGEVSRWALNTLIVTASTVILSVIVSSTAGYAFAFYRFPAKSVIWTVLLFGLMLPRISLLIPLYIIIRKLGLSGQIAAVILPVAFSPVGLYLARTFFSTVPASLLESARLDGANELQVLAHVVAPISRPIITALALFSAIGSLGDFIWQSLVLQDPTRQTLLVGLIRQVMTRGGGELNVNPLGKQMAVGIILLAPLLLVFLVANRYFTQSLGQAVKE